MGEQRQGHKAAQCVDEAQSLRIVLVVCTAPRQAQEWTLGLTQGATVADALQACGQDIAWHAPPPEGRGWIGIWGRMATLDTLLRDQDRVELYRPLKVDPKVARRERFAKQGARSTGLFASKRPGAKAGY